MATKYTKKIGSDPSYKRPKKTMQEQLTAEEIEERLQGYERVDDINEVAINTHLRYFETTDDGTQLFRMGGFLQNKRNAETYVYLTNGKVSWPVQTHKAIFFRKLSHQEEIDAIHRHYKKKLQEKDEQLAKFKQFIKNKTGITYNIEMEKIAKSKSAKSTSAKTKSKHKSKPKSAKKTSGSKTSKKKYKKKNSG